MKLHPLVERDPGARALPLDGRSLWPPQWSAAWGRGDSLDEATTWDVLERLQTTYRELVPLLLGHIQVSDALTARQRADQLDHLVDELRGVAVALRCTIGRAE